MGFNRDRAITAFVETHLVCVEDQLDQHSRLLPVNNVTQHSVDVLISNGNIKHK